MSLDDVQMKHELNADSFPFRQSVAFNHIHFAVRMAYSNTQLLRFIFQ